MSVSTDIERAIMTMDAEHMRQISPRGRGSRGGKGARKRRHGNKVFTRRLSKDEEKSESIRLKVLARALSGSVEAADASEAPKVLKHHFGKKLRTDSPVSMWKDISELPHCRYILQGDSQYRAALDILLALRATIAASDDIERHCHLIMERLEAQRLAAGMMKRRAKIATEEDLLRALVRLVFDLDLRPGEKDTKKVSRLVAAAEFLISQGVCAGGVEQYYQENGGGLDEWHRSPETVNKNRQQKVAAAAEEAEARMSERDTAMKEMEEWDADKRSGPTNWAKVELPPSNEEARLAKLSGGVGRWESSMLQFFSRDRNIRNGEVMVAVVVGDARAPAQVRLVSTLKLGDILGSPTYKLLQLNGICRAIRKLAFNKCRRFPA